MYPWVDRSSSHCSNHWHIRCNPLYLPWIVRNGSNRISVRIVALREPTWYIFPIEES
jgi:hypothetical protein